MYKKIITFVCAAAISIASFLPLHAQTQPSVPVIVEITRQAEVTGQEDPVAASAYLVYLPIIMLTQCYKLISLSDDEVDQPCADLAQHIGSQTLSLAGKPLPTVIDDGHAAMFSSDMPYLAVSIPVTSTHISPQSITPISSRIIRLSAMSYMTDTADIGIVSLAAGAPFAGRIAWVILRALQDKSNPTPTLFPVSIATLHYSQPRLASNITTIFEKCADVLNAGQLALPGFPYDLIVDDAMTRGGNVWLRMSYPSCSAISGYYIKLATFYQNLKVFPQYQNIDNEATALAGPSTYHVSDLQVKMPDGQLALVGATIVVVAIGAIVIIAIFPEVGVGWWLLSGAGALQQEKK